MTNFVGRLGVTLGLNSAEFTRGIEDANKKLSELQGQIKNYSQIAGAAFLASATAAVRYADEIVDVANASDVAISSIIQLRQALLASGGEAGNASKLLSSFTGFVDKAAEGSFEAQKTLKTLGISFADLKTLSIDELMRKTAEGLAAIDDPLTRNARAMDVFGKAAKGVDFNNFNVDLTKTNGKFKDLEKGIKDASDAWGMLEEAGVRATLSLAAAVGPFLKSAIEQFSKLTDELRINGDEVAKVAKQYEVSFGRGGFSRGRQAEAPTLTPEVADAMFADRKTPDGQGTKRQVTPGIDPKAEAERKRLLENWARGFLAVQQQIQEGNDAIAKQAAELIDKEIKEVERRRDIAIRAAREEEASIEEGNRLLAEQTSQFQRRNASLAEAQRIEAQSVDRQQMMLDLMDRGRYMRANDLQLAQASLNIQWKYADLTRQIKEDEQLTADARAEALSRLINLQNKELDLAAQRFQLAQKYQQGTFAEGFQDAMKMSVANVTTTFQIGQRAFESMIGNMESALTRFVQTGKLSSKDLARSIISDLIAIQLRAQATTIFSRLIGGLFPGSTMGPPTAAAALPASFDQYLAGRRAEGGPVSANSPYLVGERGPELFVPSRSGAVVPNNQLASVMGSGQTVNYNGPVIQNMSAIDTQSGLEFLVRNKQAVWAANQSAQRSLPMSR